VAVDLSDFAAHLGFPVVPTDSEALERALAAATGMVWRHVLPNLPDPLPLEQEAALDHAILTVGGDLWRRKDAPGGTFAFADMADYPSPLSRDPMTTVYPIMVEAGLSLPGLA